MKRIAIIFIGSAVLIVGVLYWNKQNTTAPVTSSHVASAPKAAVIKNENRKTALDLPADPSQPPSEAVKFAEAANSPVDRHKELGTSIDDIVGMLRIGNLLGAYLNYCVKPGVSPSVGSGEMNDKIVAINQMLSTPEGIQREVVLFNEFQSLKDQQPHLNAAGDEASFQAIIQLPDQAPIPGDVITFVKVNDRWFLKEDL